MFYQLILYTLKISVSEICNFGGSVNGHRSALIAAWSLSPLFEKWRCRARGSNCASANVSRINLVACIGKVCNRNYFESTLEQSSLAGHAAAQQRAYMPCSCRWQYTSSSFLYRSEAAVDRKLHFASIQANDWSSGIGQSTRTQTLCSIHIEAPDYMESTSCTRTATLIHTSCVIATYFRVDTRFSLFRFLGKAGRNSKLLVVSLAVQRRNNSSSNLLSFTTHTPFIETVFPIRCHTRMSYLTWIVTGCTSGFGEHFISSILARGDRVIATGRNTSERFQHL